MSTLGFIPSFSSGEGDRVCVAVITFVREATLGLTVVVGFFSSNTVGSFKTVLETCKEVTNLVTMLSLL